MRLWKKIAMCAVLIFAVTGSFCGCESSTKKELEKPKIKELENHLKSWREKLPRDLEYTDWDTSAVRGLEIRRDGTTVFAASYEPREGKETFDYWDISVPYQSIVSVNTEELYQLFDSVFQMGFHKVEGVSLEEAGINNSQASIFVAYNREQKSGEKGLEEPTGARTILIGNTDGQGHYYMALEGSGEVALVDQALADNILNVEPYQYILKLPALISVDTVRKVQILSDEKVHIMEKEGESSKLDGKNVEQGEFQSLYGKLLDIMLSGEIGKDETDSKTGEAEEERQPSLTLQFIRNEEGISDIEVKYYERDDQFMSVNVNGKEFFLVEKSSVDDLIENVENSF